MANFLKCLKIPSPPQPHLVHQVCGNQFPPSPCTTASHFSKNHVLTVLWVAFPPKTRSVTHMPDFPQTHAFGSPHTTLLMCPSPHPKLYDIGSPVPCTAFNRLAFSCSLLLPSTSPLAALLSCSELQPRSQHEGMGVAGTSQVMHRLLLPSPAAHIQNLSTGSVCC